QDGRLTLFGQIERPAAFDETLFAFPVDQHSVMRRWLEFVEFDLAVIDPLYCGKANVQLRAVLMLARDFKLFTTRQALAQPSRIDKKFPHFVSWSGENLRSSKFH